MINWQELEAKYYMQVVKRVPVTLVRGEGARAWDDNGKEYLDFVAGWGVDCLGHCPPVLVEAVTKQVKTLLQTSNAFFTVPQVQLAQLLVENSCLDRVFVANSGTEANEGAVKLARRYGQLKRNGAYEVITTISSFHGRTLGMVAATGQAKHQQPFKPLPSGFVNVPFNDVDAIKKATTQLTCAVMLEPLQGEGGVNVPADDYLREVRRWCDEKGLLLILDEVQTGIGRLGALFGYELYGAEPDILTLAKGLGGGVPIGALMAKQAACVFALGEHGGTFGGNALTCAAAYAVVKHVIENDIPGNARRVGEYFAGKLRELKAKYSFITDVRGRGLLLALEFESDIGADLMSACLEKGLLVNQLRPNTLRFLPPLIIGEKDVDEAVAILDKAIAAVVGGKR